MVVFAFAVMPAAGQAERPYISWSADGTMLAVGGGEMVEIIDVTSSQVLNAFDELNIYLGKADWSPVDERLAIVNGSDVEVWDKSWDSSTAQLQLLYRFYEHPDEYYSATYRDPENTSSLNLVVWSHDGTLVASAVGSLIDIWNSETGDYIHRLQNGALVRDLAWNTEGKLASAGSEVITIWDIATGEPIKNLFNTIDDVELSEAYPTIFALSWDPQGVNIAFGGADGRVRIWDTTTTEFWTRSEQNDPGVYQVHSEAVLSIDWSPTGQYIASGSQDHTISIIDAQTGQQVQVIQVAPNEFVNSIAWSPDGSKLAYGSADGSVTLFDATQLPGYAPMATATAESP
jgi:WD40 repeat protein